MLMLNRTLWRHGKKADEAEMGIAHGAPKVSLGASS
jgi:hypothetical protein